MTYREYLAQLSRINAVDYQDTGTQDHLEALGTTLDDTAARAYAAVLARLLNFAPEDALEQVGQERGAPRIGVEYLAAWRNRLHHAWRFWDEAGTLPGVLEALEQLGYGVQIRALNDGRAAGILTPVAGGVRLRQAAGGRVQPGQLTLTLEGRTYTLPTWIVPADYRYYATPPTRVTEHYQQDRAVWAEFSVTVTPALAEYTAPAWGGDTRWGDGSLWGLSIRDTEVQRLLAVINEVKPAHARLRALYLVNKISTPVWGGGARWGGDTRWGDGQPVLLWQRPGVTNA